MKKDKQLPSDVEIWKHWKDDSNPFSRSNVEQMKVYSNPYAKAFKPTNNKKTND